MRLKLIIVPFFIIMILVVGIGFVKPDIDLVQTKQVALSQKETQVSGIELILNNAQTLVGLLDSQKESEDFVLSYLPVNIDQDRVIDALNFSAAQSGVIVHTMELTEVTDTAAAAAIASQLAGVPLVSGTDVNPDGTPVVIAPTRVPDTRSFVAKVVVNGKYDSIKNYFAQIAHMNRFNVMKSFSIEANHDSAADMTAEEKLNNLVGTFEASFDYVVPQQTANALNESVFQRSQFNMAPLQGTLDWVSNKVPVLQKPTTGRPNPFQ